MLPFLLLPLVFGDADPTPLHAIHADLGPSVPVVEASPFVLAAPGWAPGSLGSVTGLVRRAMAALYNGRFRTPPDRPIAVYLFPSRAPYDAFCTSHLHEPCMSVFGFYRPDLRTIFMNAGPGIGTLTHEMVHPLLEQDFDGAPTWIDEGIASLFEAPVLPRDGEIHGAKNWRLPALRAALGAPAGRTPVHLGDLFTMSDEDFRNGDESLHYAMARYVCQWLDERGQLWPFYGAWRDGHATDPTGEKAFTRATGLSLTDADAAWQAWVRRL